MDAALLDPTPLRPDPVSLGRLAALGPEHAWQVPFLLPTGWDDLTTPTEAFDWSPDRDGSPVLVHAWLHAKPQVEWKSPPRARGELLDTAGRTLRFTYFGDSRHFLEQLGKTPRPFLYGTLKDVRGRWYLNNPEVIEPRWVGRLRPIYPGRRGVIAPATVRTRVIHLLTDAIPVAADWLRGELSPEDLQSAGLSPEHLDTFLWAAHLPRLETDGRVAQERMERLAALRAVHEIRSALERRGTRSRFCMPRPCTARSRMGALPFTFTSDQNTAVRAILSDLRSDRPMRHLLNGETGSGKTAVFSVVAAAVADAGGRVAVLSPNAHLAEQTHRVIQTWFPDLDARLATGQTTDAEDLSARQIVVGTTALLHRPVGLFDMVVVDEQQKFSREQRELLTADGAHLLECSATAIPRSQALMRYGALRVSRLTDTHVRRRIDTRIWTQAQRHDLFAHVKRTLDAGQQVIVVYPRRTGTETAGADPPPEQDAPALPAAEDALGQWDRLFPGRVVLTHGGLDETRNAAAMEAMRDGSADVLVATTIVEVGIDLPRVTHIVIVHPGVLGLTQLHQLRGRVARNGGQGYCDLYLPEPVSEHTHKRLSALCETADGFRISELDLKLRGAGDLGSQSTRQWGADDGFLFGRPLRLDIMDTVLERIS